MGHTVPFKLNKPASEFQAGDSIGFGVRGGVKYRDPLTKEEAWTNYEAVLFAKSDANIKYYRDTLVEGAVVVISCSHLQIRTFDGNQGPQHNLRMINANVEYIAGPTIRSPDAAQQAYNQGMAGKLAGNQNHQRQAPPQPQVGFDSFDDDIPF